MGVSTDGIIAFGIQFDDGELPWSGHDDIEEWWNQETGFKGSANSDSYYDDIRAHQQKNPMPVEVVWHCSYDYPMFILSLPNKSINACRGYPTEFKPEDLTVTEAELKVLKDFCEKYDIEYTEPKWVVCSMWG